MSIPVTYLILALAVLVLLFLAGLFAGLGLGRRTARLEAERELPQLLEEERGDAIRRSRAVLGGQMAEQLSPWLPDFPFDPSEVRFIGKPVDFIAFVGSSEGRIDEVAFVEVKSGKASLSKVERSLKAAIEEGRVVWQEYRVP